MRGGKQFDHGTGIWGKVMQERCRGTDLDARPDGEALPASTRDFFLSRTPQSTSSVACAKDAVRGSSDGHGLWSASQRAPGEDRLAMTAEMNALRDLLNQSCV